jgi:hypothetical protein
MSEIGLFKAMWKVTFAGRRFQHDMSLHEGIDAVGGGERLFQELFDQKDRGALFA